MVCLGRGIPYTGIRYKTIHSHIEDLGSGEDDVGVTAGSKTVW